MKRGILFGVGSFLILGALRGLAEVLWGRGCTFSVDDECKVAGSVGAVIFIAIAAPLSALAIWKAIAAAPNKSWPHAIGGWLIGLCVPIVVGIMLFMAAMFVASVAAMIAAFLS
jgi:hypothetical protein